MTKLTRLAPLTAVLLAGLSGPAEARVISYAPVTARTAIPAVQSRLDRHHLLVERTGGTPGPWMGPICLTCVSTSRLVVYDAEGIDEPRDVSPGAAPSRILFAASYEDGKNVRLLVVTDATLPGETDPDGDAASLQPRHRRDVDARRFAPEPPSRGAGRRGDERHRRLGRAGAGRLAAPRNVGVSVRRRLPG